MTVHPFQTFKVYKGGQKLIYSGTVFPFKEMAFESCYEFIFVKDHDGIKHKVYQVTESKEDNSLSFHLV